MLLARASHAKISSQINHHHKPLTCGNKIIVIFHLQIVARILLCWASLFWADCNCECRYITGSNWTKFSDSSAPVLRLGGRFESDFSCCGWLTRFECCKATRVKWALIITRIKAHRTKRKYANNLNIPFRKQKQKQKRTQKQKQKISAPVNTTGDHRISEQEFLRWIGNLIQVSDLLGLADGAGAKQSGRLGDKRNEPSASTSGAQRRTHSAVGRSSSSSSPSSSSQSLLAQSIEAQQAANQQMRQRRGSGSGLALMRSLSKDQVF